LGGFGIFPRAKNTGLLDYLKTLAGAKKVYSTCYSVEDFKSFLSFILKNYQYNESTTE